MLALEQNIVDEKTTKQAHHIQIYAADYAETMCTPNYLQLLFQTVHKSA